MLDVLGQTDLGERTINEQAQADEAAMEHAPSAPCDADVSGLENLERDDRSVDQVPQLMGQEPEALALAHILSIERALILSAPVLGDGAGDGVVKASVQRAKIIGADGRAAFPLPAR